MSDRIYRQSILSTVIALIVLLGVFTATPFAVAGNTKTGLNTLEIQVLGQKYPDRPVEERVNRLEQSLNQAPPPASSMEYRVSQLYMAQQTQVSQQSQELAVKAYNRGVDASTRGAYQEAINAYNEALKYNPTLAPAYNNLANLLEQQEQYDEAILVYKKALLQTPKEPLLHRNLGVMYEKVGKIQDALAEYREYLKLHQRPDPPIEAIVSNYESHKTQARFAEDYVSFASSATEGKKLLWPRRFNPIPVYIQMSDPKQVYYLSVLQECFKKWEVATNNRIRFKEVSNPAESNIRISLQEGPLTHPYLDVGHAQYDVQESPMGTPQQIKVSITVNTGEEGSPLSLEHRQEQVGRLALHELGHAIGIWGHSPDPGDIMYTHPISNQLSQRDVRTIQKLYGVAN